MLAQVSFVIEQIQRLFNEPIVAICARQTVHFLMFIAANKMYRRPYICIVPIEDKKTES